MIKLQDCISKDSFREEQQYALATKAETVVTDANVLVVHSTVELFGEEFSNSLPEDGILLSKDALISISKATFFAIEYKADVKQVQVTHSTKSNDAIASLFPVKLNKVGLTFPQYANLFDNKSELDGEAVEIGINPKLFNNLSNAMGWNGGVELRITSSRNAIVVRNKADSLYPSAKGLIMPMMLDKV